MSATHLQILEPRQKFRCEFLLYILVTLHTPGVVVFPAQQHLPHRLLITPERAGIQSLIRRVIVGVSRYVERMQEYAKNEDNAYCREMIQDNIQDIGRGVASNALQHRFFMVFQYESQMRASPNTVQGIIQRLNEEADTARRYLDLCELEVQEPRYADDFALELLYEIINKRSSQRVKLPEGVFDMTTAVHGVYEAQTQ